MLAGVPAVVMPLVLAKKAIDKVIQNTIKSGFTIFEVSIIGGEPTLSMALVKDIIEYTRSQALKNNIKARIGIVTNGFFTKKVANYIIDAFDYATISLDGTPDIHNKQRSTAAGNNTFDRVFENAKYIHESKKIDFGVRCTVSRASVKILPEIVSFLNKSFPGITVGVEPLHECGRCATSGEFDPDDDEYAKQLAKTILIAKQEGITLKSSILRFRKEPTHIGFCGVNGQNFGVDPNGYVSACTRVTSTDDPMSKLFYFGQFNPVTDDFVFDNNRYQQLKKLEADNIPECQDCFALFNCKGDCPIVKADFGNNPATTKSQRCESIKAVTKSLFEIQLGIKV